ncbi:hypothetical protein CR513_05042, partial [Mucuna pruriens]
MSCVIHCLDLMLKDIGKIVKVKNVIQRGIKLVGYIYNHSLTLNTMRKFTNKSELVSHGVTRFATTFLVLQRLHKQKSKATKDVKGKKATNINDVVYPLKVMGPIVCVLRLMDNEERPAIGYVFKNWIISKRRFKNLLMTIKININIALQSLIEDGNANFTTLCMQLVVF